MGRMEAGTATVGLRNTEGTYWPATNPDVLPVKRINIRWDYDGIVYDLYTGFIESWNPKWVLHPITGAVMDLQCADLFKNLSYCSLDISLYPDELSGTRVSRVLTDMGWLGGSDVDAGVVIVAETPIDTTYENATQHLGKVSDTEDGRVYIAPDGDVQFEGRYHRMFNHNTPLAVFGDNLTLGDLPIFDYSLTYDDEHIYNEIRVSIPGGDPQLASDATSQTTYGKRVLEVTQSLGISDSDCLALAQHYLAMYKDPHMRAKSITIKPGKDPANLYPKAFGYEISDLITVRLTQAGILESYFIEGIEHDWKATEPNNWTTKWQLSSSVGTGPFWRLENATYGKLESTTILGY